MASATATRATPALSDEQREQLVALIKDADSVELKLTVPAEDQRSTIAALGLDPLDAQIRQVFFFDTPDLALDKAGVVVRARRRIQGKGDDSVVKLRPVVPRSCRGRAAQVAELRRRGRRDARRVRLLGIDQGSARRRQPSSETCRGKRPLRKLFSKEQRAFYAEHAPEGIELDDLVAPRADLRAQAEVLAGGLRAQLVAEMWLYPDGSRILELSTKCAPAEAFQVAAETRAFLDRARLDLAGEQQTKTRTALEFFSRHLGAESDGERERPSS